MSTLFVFIKCQQWNTMVQTGGCCLVLFLFSIPLVCHTNRHTWKLLYKIMWEGTPWNVSVEQTAMISAEHPSPPSTCLPDCAYLSLFLSLIYLSTFPQWEHFYGNWSPWNKSSRYACVPDSLMMSHAPNTDRPPQKPKYMSLARAFLLSFTVGAAAQWRHM